MKKMLILMAIFAITTTSVFSQEKGRSRSGFNFGINGINNMGGNIVGDWQFGYNLQDNINIGIKLGMINILRDTIQNQNFIQPMLFTTSYYFNSGKSSFAPFVGGGIGYYVITNRFFPIEDGNKFGGLLTAGFEAKKFRMALEYNLIPKSTVVYHNYYGAYNKYIRNSSFACTIGFYWEGGKWNKQNRKVGFLDNAGNIVIPAKYGYDLVFSEDLACLKVANKWGFIDKKSQEVIPFMFDEAGNFSEGLANVRVKEKWGFIDKTGKEVITFKYQDARKFSEGLALVKNNNKWGFINEKGIEVIPFSFDEAEGFSEGLARVKINHIWSFIDKTGKSVSEKNYTVKSENNSDGISNIQTDIITLRNGEVITAKVTEISQTEIRYKRFDNLEGPTRIIPIKEVFAINYANGTREVINALNNTNAADAPKSKLGLRAGANFSSLSGITKSLVTNNSDVDIRRETGFQAGIISENPFKKNPQSAFVGGILYTQLGTILENKQNIVGLNVIETGKIKIHSLQFRSQYQYKNEILLLQAGFCVDYYLKVDYKYEITIDGKKVDGDSNSFYSNEGIAYDLGLALGAAFLIGKNFQIGAGYDIGLKTDNLMVNMTLFFGND